MYSILFYNIDDTLGLESRAGLDKYFLSYLKGD